jgi:hypothetical protein
LQAAALEEFSAALDEMAVKKESTIQRLRDAARAAKEQTAQQAGKEPKVKARKRTEPEL